MDLYIYHSVNAVWNERSYGANKDTCVLGVKADAISLNARECLTYYPTTYVA